VNSDSSPEANDNALELRYTGEAKTRDLLFAAVPAMVLGSAAAMLLRDRVDDVTFPFILAAWTGAGLPFVLVAGIWRWGRRGRMDVHGASMMLSSRGPVERLAWEEVEEVFRVGQEGVELRGASLRLRFSGDFAPLGGAWAWVGRFRGAALGAELQRKVEAGETLRFRGPVEPGIALLRAAALVAFLLPAAAAPLVFLSRLPARPMPSALWWSSHGMAVFATAWVSIILLGMLAAVLSSCGWVELGPRGLAFRTAVFPAFLAWDEIRSVEATKGSYLQVRIAAGRSVLLPTTYANGRFLEELIRRRFVGQRPG
jgi:hypothetical protein